MKKIKIFLKINDIDIKGQGVLQNNILSFSSDGITYNYDFYKDVFLKKDEIGDLKLYFNNDCIKSDYYIKKANKSIPIKLVIKQFTIEKNKVIIRYEIEEETFYFVLSYMEE